MPVKAYVRTQPYQKETIPTLYESYEKAGEVQKGIAQKPGFDYNIVYTGVGENTAAAVGTGTVGNGNSNLSVGQKPKQTGVCLYQKKQVKETQP